MGASDPMNRIAPGNSMVLEPPKRAGRRAALRASIGLHFYFGYGTMEMGPYIH